MLCFQAFTYVRTARFSNARTLFICTILFYPTPIIPAAFVTVFYSQWTFYYFSRLAFLKPLLPFFCPQIKYLRCCKMCGVVCVCVWCVVCVVCEFELCGVCVFSHVSAVESVLHTAGTPCVTFWKPHDVGTWHSLQERLKVNRIYFPV